LSNGTWESLALTMPKALCCGASSFDPENFGAGRILFMGGEDANVIVYTCYIFTFFTFKLYDPENFVAGRILFMGGEDANVFFHIFLHLNYMTLKTL
jgi:hypothetical protein